MKTYTDIWNKKMELIHPGGYPNRRTIRFKNAEFWITYLSPCEIAYLLVSATSVFSSSEIFFDEIMWSTIQDEVPEPRVITHCIGIPEKEVFFTFDMKADYREEDERSKYSSGDDGVDHIDVFDDSFFVGTPEDGFDITKEDFSSEIPEISWKDFLTMVDVVAYNQFEYTTKSLRKSNQRNLDKIETLTPFRSTALCKKIEEMDVDKKFINRSRAKDLGLW